MNLLAVWIIFLIILAVITTISGAVVGIVARRLHLSDRRIHLMSWFGTFILLVVAELARKHLHLPYPPQMFRSMSTSSGSIIITVCLALLCFHLSERIAKRLVQRGHSID